MQVYPPILPLEPGTRRPFWSVMIPTYHCAAYLEHTLRSVLDQAPSSDDMQIEVVDDGSFRDDPEGVVNTVAGRRVSFFRQPTNVGPQANFTDCIKRAKGHWIHILHGDDMVRPGFYEGMRRGAESAPAAKAAFCRVITIDERNGWIELSEREQSVAGVVPDLVDRLAVYNHIMFPSIVVQRTAYEELGGFHPELFHAADWDMWKRIAAAFPVWYDPEPLALYRLHTMSDTSRLMQTGANILDARRAIGIASGYLPADREPSLRRSALLYHALYAVEVAHERRRKGDWAAVRAQLREGLACSRSPRVWGAVLDLLLFNRAPRPWPSATIESCREPSTSSSPAGAFEGLKAR